MKKQQLVQIPVGHICITESEFLHMHKQLIIFQSELRLRTSECCSLDDEVENLKKQLSDAEAKVADLEKELNEKQDRVLYWYQKYTELADKLNAVKDHAEAEKA
jgi:peptidoglycan hydrolase CwlO-like protein